jgi:hypothetical protein
MVLLLALVPYFVLRGPIARVAQMGLEARIELVASWGDQMEHVTSKSDASAISTELAERRTGMSFQRTCMSADRTLISVIRRSLSLISFGFTIFQVFQKLRDQNVLSGARPPAISASHWCCWGS